MKEALARGYARAFARPGRLAQAVNHTMLHLGLRGMGYNNGWQPERSGELWFIRNVLAPSAPRTCLDVGGNIGAYSRLLLEHTAARDVYAFEPLPGCHLLLEGLAASTPRMHVVPVAVGAEHGKATLHYGAATSEHASLSMEVGAIPYVGATNIHTTEVTVLSLDDWMRYSIKDYEFDRIDFIKIDVEGYEREVLWGARELIAVARPTFIQIEWNLHQLMRGYTLRAMSRLLPDYDVYQMLPRGLRKVDVDRPEANIFCYGNFVFVRRGALA